MLLLVICLFDVLLGDSDFENMFWQMTVIVVSFSPVVSDWNVNIDTWLIFMYFFSIFLKLFWLVVFAVGCVYMLCILNCEPDCWLWFDELWTQYDPLWLSGHWASRLKQCFIFLQHYTLCLPSGNFGLLNCEMSMIQICILKYLNYILQGEGASGAGDG